MFLPPDLKILYNKMFNILPLPFFTGIERDVAKNSGHLILAEADGEVIKADANEVHVKYAQRDRKSVV